MAKTKEDQQKRVLEYQHFQMTKFKVADEIASVKFYEHGNEHTMTPKEHVHPDLKEALEQLKLYMAQRLGLLEGWDFSREHVKKDSESLTLAIQGHKDTIARCNVNGFTFVGDGETAGVQLTGSVKLPHGGSVGLAVAKITFGKDVLGYEDEVQEICEEIKKEVYAYLFQAKKLQLDIETEAEKAKQSGMFDDDDAESEERITPSMSKVK